MHVCVCGSHSAGAPVAVHDRAAPDTELKRLPQAGVNSYSLALRVSCKSAGAGGAAAHVHRTVPGGLCGARAGAAPAAHRRAAPCGSQSAPASGRRCGVPRRRQLPRAAPGQPLPARLLPVARVGAAGALVVFAAGCAQPGLLQNEPLPVLSYASSACWRFHLYPREFISSGVSCRPPVYHV